MSELGRILLADDEETFLHSTADLLRREGYYCDCVPDAATGIERLKHNDYDLLIADIKMPGNPNLELIRDLPDIVEDMSVILVTGYPSQSSAIQAVQLPVVAYLVKPLDFENLLKHVTIAIRKTHLYRAVVNTKKRLQYWKEGLVNLEEVLKNSKSNLFSASAKEFIDLTFANISGALMDIRYIALATTSEDSQSPMCHLLNCPKLAELDAAVNETIKALERTKGAFKSKELGTIRRKLEDIVEKRKKANMEQDIFR